MTWFTKGPPKKIWYISAVGTGVGGLYLLRDTFKGTTFDKTIRCDNKVVLLTEGIDGVGKVTARELAKRGAVLFLLHNDEAKCAEVRRSIVLESKNKYVYCRECDLGSLESIRNFAEGFKKSGRNIDILINNASVWRKPQSKTVDGFESHLGINHLGPFLLTNLMLEHFRSSEHSRILNITSAAYSQGTINRNDLNSDQSYNVGSASTQSRFANILFTLALSRRLANTGVTVNAVNPGVLPSDLPKGEGFGQVILSILFAPFSWLFLKTDEGAAQAVLYAALDPSLEKVTGKYIVNCKETELVPRAKDEETAEWLWAVSDKWTKLTQSAKQVDHVS